METLWLIKLIFAHLMTDFVLQPKSWVRDRHDRHFGSPYLYIHGAVTALFAGWMIGSKHWHITVIIFVTHILIDGWKSYRKNTAGYFLIDQLLHLAVILGCWWFSFYDFAVLQQTVTQLLGDEHLWILLTAVVFLTGPSGILIAKLTERWRLQLENSETLGNAGKWIGILERIMVLAFALLDQFEAIGLLIAAKGILRFSEKDRPEMKTEYLLIGTLISISLAVFVALIVKRMI